MSKRVNSSILSPQKKSDTITSPSKDVRQALLAAKSASQERPNSPGKFIKKSVGSLVDRQTYDALYDHCRKLENQLDDYYQRYTESLEIVAKLQKENKSLDDLLLETSKALEDLSIQVSI